MTANQYHPYSPRVARLRAIALGARGWCEELDNQLCHLPRGCGAGVADIIDRQRAQYRATYARAENALETRYGVDTTDLS